MAIFSNLPNELISEIGTHVMPDDLENFTLASKRIYALALPVLREHRELKERYSAFGNLDKAAFDGLVLKKSDPRYEPVTKNCDPVDGFSKLLTTVLKSHRMAPYVKELRSDGLFDDWDFLLHSPSNGAPEPTPYTKEQLVLFKQALSKYVIPSKLEEWTRKLESGHRSPIISLLLILLSNINSIKLEQCVSTANQVQEMIERIKRDCIPGALMLSHLERVNLQYNDYFSRPNPRLIAFLAFLATIPSLKTLYGQNIVTFGGAHDFSCLLPRSSNITELGFKACDLSLGQLANLLQGLKALRKFHYIYNMYDEEYDMEPWNPAGMCRLLSRYAQASLELLDLRSEEEPVEPIKTLRNFECLRELTLSFSSFRTEGRSPSRTLVSQLPASLEGICLYEIDCELGLRLESAIGEAIHWKRSRLPRLEKLFFYGSQDLEKRRNANDELQKLCEQTGFELRFLQEE